MEDILSQGAGGVVAFLGTLFGLFVGYEKLRRHFSGGCEDQLQRVTLRAQTFESELNVLRSEHARLEERLFWVMREAGIDPTGEPRPGGKRSYDRGPPGGGGR